MVQILSERTTVFSFVKNYFTVYERPDGACFRQSAICLCATLSNVPAISMVRQKSRD
jgi:hypothetical protein